MRFKLLILDVSGTLLDGHDWGELYPGAYRFVEVAHRMGYELALASNLGRGGLKKFMTAHGLDKFIQTAVSADDATFKPSPEMIELVLSLTGHPAGDALMIGDSSTDIQAAHAAGVAACHVTWAGDDPRVATLNPLYTAKSFDDLAKLVGMN